jgi:hypothetical protein
MKQRKERERESISIYKDYIVLSLIYIDMNTKASIYREAMSDKKVT